MPILENERHELFAQKLAEGKSATEAYQLAGFKPSRKNASRLRANEGVSARVAELQCNAARASEVSIQSILVELNDAIDVARTKGQAQAMVSASSMKAKISGLLTTKVELEVSRTDDDGVPHFWVESDFPRTIELLLTHTRERYPGDAKMLSWTDAMADTQAQYWPHSYFAWRSPSYHLRRQRKVIDGVAQRATGNGKGEG